VILVTGASGLLGASVLMRALKAKTTVTGLSYRHRFQLPGTDIHNLDLTDWSACRRVIADVNPSAIIHCAAATNVDWCEDHREEAFQINTRTSSYLAELAHGIGAKFVHISTDSVFDGNKGNYSELDTPAPLNVYARTKLSAEQEVLGRHQSPLILRVNFYGWNIQPKQSLAEWILTQLEQGQVVPGFVDVHFCPTFVNDLADILFNMLDRCMSGIYHVVGSEKVSKFEYARRLAMVFGFSPERIVPISVGQAKLRANRPRNVSLNIEKVATELGCKLPDIDSGLQRFKALRHQNYICSPTVMSGAET
jgi:dTDP-4-dehydrorhamnose reductase